MHTKIGLLTICVDRPTGQCQIFSPETVVRDVEGANTAASVAASLGVDFTFCIVPAGDDAEWKASGWTPIDAVVVIKESKR